MIRLGQRDYLVSRTFRPRVGERVGYGCNGAVYALRDDPARVVKIVNYEQRERFDHEVDKARRMGELGVGPRVCEVLSIPAERRRVRLRGFTMDRLERPLGREGVREHWHAVVKLLCAVAFAGYQNMDLHANNLMLHRGRVYMVDFDELVTCAPEECIEAFADMVALLAPRLPTE